MIQETPNSKAPLGAPPVASPEAASNPAETEETSAPGTPETAESTSITAEAAESLLEAKRLGERIKFLRLRKQMGLVELGKYTGLSASFLSQLETGRVVPTLRNLARIAMVFSRDMSYFFEPDEPELFRIVRAADRQRLPQSGVEDPNYFFESLGQVPAFDSGSPSQRIVPYIAEFLPRHTTNGTRALRSHQHSGAEFLYMLSGRLKLTHDGQEDIFEEGDAVYFHSSATHSYESISEESCTALILTLPEAARGHHTGSRVLNQLPKPTPKKP